MKRARPATERVPTTADSAFSGVQAFDLNIERVLEHWPTSFAIRELLANALDEQAITSTADPVIELIEEGTWRIRDFGRGLQYQHFTQKENPEKLKHSTVIGQFGIGLKDALAVLDRKRVGVTLRSCHGDVSTARRPKADFADVNTLHAMVAPPSDPALVGTEVVISGVNDDDVAQAMSFFLRYSGDRVLEQTRYGEVLQRAENKSPGRIYVKGLLVAEEQNFLFSYNVTAVDKPLRRALNRERSNVGRDAYSARVKRILLDSRGADVAGPLARELRAYQSGRLHDELGWKDVVLHACRVLQSISKVVFVTPWQIGDAATTHAQDDGYEVVVVSDDVAASLGSIRGFDDRPMLNLDAFREEWNSSFNYQFVPESELTPVELGIFGLADQACQLAGVDLERLRIALVVSETTRLSVGSEVLGVWEPLERRIVIRRDQLGTARRFLGTFLHELTHATSGFPDLSLAFEEALTTRMGKVAAVAVRQRKTV